MATERTSAECLALLADNTSGDISPADMRDVFATMMGGFGHIDFEAASLPVVMNSVGTVATPLPYDKIEQQSSGTYSNGVTANLATGGFVVGPAGDYNITANLTFTVSGAATILRMTPIINGTPQGLFDTVETESSNARFRALTGTFFESVPTNGTIALGISLPDDPGRDVTIESAQCSIKRVG